MCNELKDILALQEVDIEIFDREHFISQSPVFANDFKERSAFLDSEEHTLKANVLSIEKHIKAMELECAEAQTRISKCKDRQSSLLTIAEVEANRKQQKLAEDQLDELESTEIELLEKLEIAKAARTSGVERCEVKRAVLRKELAELKSKIIGFQTELKKLKPNRDKLAILVEKELYDRYETSRNAKGGKRVAIFSVCEDNSCSSCHIKLRAGTIQNLHAGGITNCGDCGAMLYGKQFN